MNSAEVRDQIIASLEPDCEFIDFIPFSQSVVEQTTKAKTAEWYKSAIDLLCWFYNRKKIDVRDITAAQMSALKEKLAIAGPSGRPLSPGAISNYLRAIRALHNKAKKHYNNEDYDIIRIPGDPFSKVKIPQYRRARKSLSVQDIKRIRDGNFSTGRANMARDVFMIMFYMMGININDLYNLIKRCLLIAENI